MAEVFPVGGRADMKKLNLFLDIYPQIAYMGGGGGGGGVRGEGLPPDPCTLKNFPLKEILKPGGLLTRSQNLKIFFTLPVYLSSILT